MDSNRMDHVSFDDCHVWYGNDHEAVGFCHRVPKAEGCHNRLSDTVYRDASAGLFLGKLFGLDNELLVGVVIVGTCPGGTSSNVITYLSKGDTALSVGMTSINTLLAPLLTPLLTYLYLRTTVSVPMMSMFVSILQVVIVPISLGLLINQMFGTMTRKVSDALPAVSVTAICLIVASVVSHNSEKIRSTGLMILAVVVLHNLLGYLCGYLVGVLFQMDLPRKKAISIEVGMQNSGLATTLAGSAFPDLTMATVPGAIFSVWHNISGALLAGFLSKKR